MESFEIEDKETYIQNLFEQERYDSFYLYEARVKTNLDYYINGKQNAAYFDTEQQPEQSEYIAWKDVKQTVRTVMQGQRLPLFFKIILMFNRENILRLLEMNNLPIKEEDIGALFLNLVYEHENLTVTTGTSLKIFTMDKRLDQIWSDTVRQYYM